jgi:hypothetical protein
MKTKTSRDAITIVSGLPRSGTSMMMKMLDAGGMPILTDNLRTADEDNPKGYYEFELVKQLENNHAWLKDAHGKAVKIISQLLKSLPAEYHYKIIFMRRNMDEILASQRQMLIRRGEPADTVGDEKMARIFQMHLIQVESWLQKQPNIEVLYIQYNDVLKNPVVNIKQINQFLDGRLDEGKMASVVDKSLHRQRA